MVGQKLDLLRVTHAGEEKHVVRGQTLFFGRSSANDIQLSPTDTLVSRRCGRIEWDGHWILRNESASHHLEVILPGRPAITLRGGEPYLLFRSASVAVHGVRRYELNIQVAREKVAHVAQMLDSGEVGTEVELVTLTPRQQDVAEALALGYRRLGNARHPLTYRDVADLLGISARTVEKHALAIRDSLIAAGVPHLADSPDCRAVIVEWWLQETLQRGHSEES